MTFTIVSSDVLSSNRIAYPTSPPSSHPISCAIRIDTLTAAMRLGCVSPIRPVIIGLRNNIRGNCVVLPHPVGPCTTITWCDANASLISCWCLYIGNCVISVMINLYGARSKQPQTRPALPAPRNYTLAHKNYSIITTAPPLSVPF